MHKINRQFCKRKTLIKYGPRGKKEFIWNILAEVGQKKKNWIPGSLGVSQPSRAVIYYYLSLTLKLYTLGCFTPEMGTTFWNQV